ncbi:DUF305 domain-containing protein [Noviherbaspirillum suwonense]|uniref:Uncharacterized conserved protein, DUF305 family n=1 Tax=Noviherbaspirillum suwonense TaxID=1224511 RepID=A0ABY1QV50_9BURK|nr:DUF305 domain-containing protein [Noviherbaspirillum suwonense]SMP81324.1 Uncharacterized conserved protein, DUF305 family [Noviherbaspirillum suwonense]
MSPLRNTAIALLALALANPVFAQDAKSHSDMQGMHGMHAVTSSPNAAKAPYDHQFLDTMSAHHQSAMEMAKLVDERSAHDELKKMAKKMIEDQQKDIQQLQDWKKQWYANKGDAVNMKMPGMESMKSMSMDRLAASKGEQFDAMFLDMMPKHHAGGIKMAKDALKKAKHSEIKQFSQKTIDCQTGEIAEMEKWKKEWKVAGK